MNSQCRLQQRRRRRRRPIDTHNNTLPREFHCDSKRLTGCEDNEDDEDDDVFWDHRTAPELKRTSESPNTEELALPSSDDGSSCSLPPLRLQQHAAGGSRARMDATAIAAATEKKWRMQTRPRTQSVVPLHSLWLLLRTRGEHNQSWHSIEEAKPSQAQERRSPPPDPLTPRAARSAPRLAGASGVLPLYSVSRQHGCCRARVPEQGCGVMGHNLVDAEDQNAKSGLGLCMSLGVVGTSGGGSWSTNGGTRRAGDHLKA